MGNAFFFGGGGKPETAGSATPLITTQVYTPPAGYNYSSFTVYGATASIIGNAVANASNQLIIPGAASAVGFKYISFALSYSGSLIDTPSALISFVGTGENRGEGTYVYGSSVLPISNASVDWVPSGGNLVMSFPTVGQYWKFFAGLTYYYVLSFY